jgi:RHS repeat-associated protein
MRSFLLSFAVLVTFAISRAGYAATPTPAATGVPVDTPTESPTDTPTPVPCSSGDYTIFNSAPVDQGCTVDCLNVSFDVKWPMDMSVALNSIWYIYVARRSDPSDAPLSADDMCHSFLGGPGWYAYVSTATVPSHTSKFTFQDQIKLPYGGYTDGDTWDVYFVTQNPFTIVGPVTYTAHFDPAIHTSLVESGIRGDLPIGSSHTFYATSPATNDCGSVSGAPCDTTIYQWTYSIDGATATKTTFDPSINIDLPDDIVCGSEFRISVKAGFEYSIQFVNQPIPSNFNFFYTSDSPQAVYRLWKAPSVSIVSPKTPVKVDACNPQPVPVVLQSCGCFEVLTPPEPAPAAAVDWFYSSEAPGTADPTFTFKSATGNTCSDTETWSLDTKGLAVGQNIYYPVVTDAEGTAAQASGNVEVDPVYKGYLQLNFCVTPDMTGAQGSIQAVPVDDLNPGPSSFTVDTSLSESFTFNRTDQKDQEVQFQVSKDLYEPYPSSAYDSDPNLNIVNGQQDFALPMCQTTTLSVCLLPLGITLTGQVFDECQADIEPLVPYCDLQLLAPDGVVLGTGQTDIFGNFTLWFRPEDTDVHDYKLEASKDGFESSGKVDVGNLQAGQNQTLSNFLVIDPTECEQDHDRCSVSNPLDVQTGERLLFDTDLSVPGRGGLDFSFQRFYQGLPPVQPGVVGFGWNHNWDVHLKPQREGGYVVHFADGKWHRFRPDGHGGYLAMNGFFYQLVLVNGCLELVSPEGLRYHFAPDDNGKLSWVYDRFGNKISLAYNPASPAGPAAGQLAQVTDSGGRIFQFSYVTVHSRTALQSLQYPDPSGSGTQTLTYSYDQASGDLLAVQDSQPLLNAYNAQYRYNASHQVVYKLDPHGPKSYRRAQYAYDSRGRSTATYRLADSVSTPIPTPVATADVRVSYPLDGQGHVNPQMIIDGYSRSDGTNSKGQWSGQTVNGISNSRTWDTANQGLSGITDFRGNLTSYTYWPGNQGLLKTMKDPLGVLTTILSYDSFAQVTSRTVNDPNSGVTRTFDAVTDGAGRTISTTESGTDVSTPRVTSYKYDPSGFGQWTQMTDPDGRIFQRIFNAQGLLQSHLEVSAGLETDYTYDALGRVKTISDQATGLVTTNTYDAAGNLVDVRYDQGANSSHVQSTYDNNGNLLSRQDEEGKLTTYAYSQDGKENLQSVQGPSGLYARSYIYTPDTNLLQTETLSGPGYSQTRDYTYIQACACSIPGKLQSIVLHGATVSGLPNQALTTAFTYDNDGNRQTVTDPKGTVTKTDYDAASRVKAVTTGYGSATPRSIQYSPDGFGQNLTLTDGKNQATNFKYDALGRLEYERPAQAPDLNFGYSPAGQLIQKTDRDGRAWTGIYDGGGRLASETFQDGNAVNQTETYSYGQNGDGTRQLKQATDSTGGSTFSYGFRDRLAKSTAQNRQLSYTYDQTGFVASLTLKDLTDQAPDKTCTYIPDDLHRTQQFTDWRANTYIYTYNAANQIMAVTYKNAAGKTVANGIFTYDSAGQQLNAVYRSASGVLLARVDYQYDLAGNRTERNSAYATNSFTYDSQYQLLSENNSADIRGPQTFTYDNAGNRLSKQMGALAAVNYSFNNLLNRVMGQTGGGEANATYSYDAEGNRIQKVSVPPPAQEDNGTTGYTFDGKQRLTKVTLPDGTVITYAYDYQNRMVSRTQGSEVRTYIYGTGNQVIEETLNGKRLALYGWGPDGLVSRTDADGRSLYFLKDALGSVIAVLDDRGTVVQSMEYSAFGECLSGGDAVNPFRFVGGFGGYTDDATGLINFWNRWYDPQVGRWVSEDPIRQAGGVNLYGYVGNNPAIATDATGLVVASYSITNQTLTWVRTGGKDVHVADNVVSGVDSMTGQPWLTFDPNGPIPVGLWGFETPGMGTSDNRRVMLYPWPGTDNQGRGVSVKEGHLEFHGKGPKGSNGCPALDSDDLTQLLKDISADGGGRLSVTY